MWNNSVGASLRVVGNYFTYFWVEVHGQMARWLDGCGLRRKKGDSTAKASGT